MRNEMRKDWDCLTAVLNPMPLGVGLQQETKEWLEGRPMVADLYEDQETEKLVQICRERELIRWSKKPSSGELLGCGGCRWVPFPESAKIGRYPWRADGSAS